MGSHSNFAHERRFSPGQLRGHSFTACPSTSPARLSRAIGRRRRGRAPRPLQCDAGRTSIRVATFPVPVLDRCACFATKLTAANDRGLAAPYKDVVDLIVMRACWGEIPAAAIEEAERHYGAAVLPKAKAAIARFLALPADDKRSTAVALGMATHFFEQLGALKKHDGDEPSGGSPALRSFLKRKVE